MTVGVGASIGAAVICRDALVLRSVANSYFAVRVSSPS